MAKYLAETVNPDYAGMVARIKFAHGRAMLDEDAAEGTGRDVPQIVRIFKELGITLTEIHECPRCGKTCQSKFALTGHMKTHAGEPEEPAREPEDVKED